MTISEVKKGDRLIEYSYWRGIEYVALEDGTFKAAKGDYPDGWHCNVKTDDGEVIHLFAADGLDHYGPDIELKREAK